MFRKIMLVGLLVSTALMTGCSSKPEVGDVEPIVKSLWSQCNLVRPTDFKKANGVDQGNSYEISYSYKLEVTRDIAAEDIWDSTFPKEQRLSRDEYPQITDGLERVKKEQELNATRNAAIAHWDRFIKENCAPPIAEKFIEIVSDKRGAPLKKGEKFNVDVASLTMVESEKGWIPQ